MKSVLLFTILISLLWPLNGQGAGDLMEYDVFLFDGFITVDFDFSDLFTPEQIHSIRSGYPLHIDFLINLKKYLPLWFDPDLRDYHSVITVEYQNFGARFRLHCLDFDGNVHQADFRDIKELVEALNESLTLRSVSAETFSPDDKLYFSFRVELRFLTMAELSRAADWYRGKSPEVEDSQAGDRLIPGKVFGYLLDISGLGPRSLRLSGPTFNPSQLKIVMPANP